MCLVQQRSLGRSGLTVSRLGLGLMTWGNQTDEHEAREQLTAFIDAGGTLLDTAHTYAGGASEELLGKLLAEVVSRRDVVVATKAGVGMRRGARVMDTSRGYLLSCLDLSLQRLGVDSVDLWQVHVWSDKTPIEETLSALDTAVSTGRAAYVGVSNWSGWRTAQGATWQRAAPGPGAAGLDAGRVLAAQPRHRARGGAGRHRAGPRHPALVAARPRGAHRQVPHRHPRGLAGRLGPVAVRRRRTATSRPRPSSRRSSRRPTAWVGSHSRWRWRGSATSPA